MFKSSNIKHLSHRAIRVLARMRHQIRIKVNMSSLSLKSLAKKILPRKSIHALDKAPVGHSHLSKQKATVSVKAGPRLSLVVAAYNVENYIERFLGSVFGQSSKLTNFEVIIVNDGSTDRTGEIVKLWQNIYPKHIKYIYQKNAGAGAARNTGLSQARGTWVGFPDADDFLDVDYFRIMLKETEVEHKNPLIAVISNYIFYFEDKNQFSDTHPLRYRFQSGVVRKKSHDLDQHMQLSTNCCWLHRETLVKHTISFDKRVVPAFEDAHLLNRLLIAAPERTVTFLPSAKYYYRKRADQTSLIDGSKEKASWYLDQIEHGYLNLLSFAKAMRGVVPKHLQRMCLYDIFYRFRYIVDRPERTAFLTKAQLARFLELVRDVFSYIDSEVIENFNLAGCTEEHKVALLALYKDQRRSSTAVYIEKIDAANGIAQFSYFSGGDDVLDVRPLVNGADIQSCYASQRISKFLDKTYARQNFFWIPLEDGDEISFNINNQPCRIRKGGRALGFNATWLTLRNALEPAMPTDLTDEAKRLRAYILASRHKYRGSMVLMDRNDKADDNAEHLYRHLMETGRGKKAWFILSRDSVDWPRLEAEGFQLLDFGSDEHVAAQMNADFLISSHADHYVLWPVLKKDFEDLAKYKFVFLQHGILTADLSEWLNKKPIRLLITSTHSEYENISGYEGSYIFGKREVLLSGLPRHDTLLSKKKFSKPDSILIMPTWRKYLTDESNRIGGMRRDKIENFLDSNYARNWSALLNSPILKNLAKINDLRVVFAPHPYMAMYLEDLILPEFIEKVDVRLDVSYQDLFARARVAVTCFSSAVTEVAYLQRPLVYFQFDQDEVFSGSHTYQKGYFSFEKEGFGPVTTVPEEALSRLEQALSGQEDPVYAMRRQAAFPFRDGNCCERICKVIESLNKGKSGISEVAFHHTDKPYDATRAA